MKHHALQQIKFQQRLDDTCCLNDDGYHHLVYHHHDHHHHKRSVNVTEGDDICVTVLVNYVAQ